LLYDNPAYLGSLNDLETRGVVAHEILHVANGHCWRQGDRDPGLWNDACDYATNPIVYHAGMLLPKGALLDARFRGKSAEESRSGIKAGSAALIRRWEWERA
jgi:predicted metal-dependent peptidase